MPVHTFSGLGGQNTLEKLCKWAFDHHVNEGAVLIAHNSSKYDPHFILSYLITNGEYPEILVNGGKLLEIILKQSLDIFNMKSNIYIYIYIYMHCKCV